MHGAVLSGANHIWHSAGWLEAGLTCGYSKFATDCEQLVGWYKHAGGLSFADFNEAMATVREVGPAGHFLGTQHTLDNFQKAFFMPSIMDFNPCEQWAAEGAKDHDQRGRGPFWPTASSFPWMPEQPIPCGTSSPGASARCRTPRPERTAPQVRKAVQVPPSANQGSNLAGAGPSAAVAPPPCAWAD